jgi:hypothetical protein
MAWTSTAVIAITPNSSGHRPRRHATAAMAQMVAAFRIAAVHSSARASPPVRRNSGAASQNSNGPG